MDKYMAIFYQKSRSYFFNCQNFTIFGHQIPWPGSGIETDVDPKH